MNNPFCFFYLVLSLNFTYKICRRHTHNGSPPCVAGLARAVGVGGERRMGAASAAHRTHPPPLPQPPHTSSPDDDHRADRRRR